MAIYTMFRGRPTEASYQLSKIEQESLFEKERGAVEQAGAENVVVCETRWSSEKWMIFGVDVFPDLAAFEKYTRLVEELNWYRYVDSEAQLGTKWREGQPAMGLDR